MGESGRMRWRNEDFLGAALHDQISKPMDAINMFKVDQIQTLLVTQHMMFVCFCFFLEYSIVLERCQIGFLILDLQIFNDFDCNSDVKIGPLRAVDWRWVFRPVIGAGST